MPNKDIELSKILMELSHKQHSLGIQGLIPLSKHENEAAKKLLAWKDKSVNEAKYNEACWWFKNKDNPEFKEADMFNTRLANLNKRVGK